MNLEYSEAAVEILDLLNHTTEDLVQKIPKQLIEFWEKNASKTYESKIDYSLKMEDMQLKPKTKAIIGMIYRNYWCTPEERKEYDLIIAENERRFQEEAREKYNPDDALKSKKEEQVEFVPRNKFEKINEKKEEIQNNSLVEYKDNILKKIIRKIKIMLKIKV